MFSRIWAKVKKITGSLWFNIALACILLVLLLFPLYPLIFYHFRSLPSQTSLFRPLSLNAVASKTPDEREELLKKYPKNEFLVIDKIGLFSPIFNGEEKDMDWILEKGVWHYSDTADPGEKGRAVIIGHRFRYKPPSLVTFYLLDKLSSGDEIQVRSTDKVLVFKVTDKNVVDDTDRSAYDQDTEEEQLELITCTPIFTTEKRLVISAKLTDTRKN